MGEVPTFRMCWTCSETAATEGMCSACLSNQETVAALADRVAALEKALRALCSTADIATSWVTWKFARRKLELDITAARDALRPDAKELAK